MKTRLLVTMLVIGLAAGTHAANTSSFRSPSTSGSSGNPIFVGTIESVNISNRTIVVNGQESAIVTQYNQYQTGNTRNTSRNRNTVYNNQPVRTLQSKGTAKSRTFEVGGFCKIQTGDHEPGRMGQPLLTIASLKEGERVSVEFTEGVGGRYTATLIQPLAALDVVGAKDDKGTTTTKKKKK
jgi:hypothetical protein